MLLPCRRYSSLPLRDFSSSLAVSDGGYYFGSLVPEEQGQGSQTRRCLFGFTGPGHGRRPYIQIAGLDLSRSSWKCFLVEPL